MRLITPLNSKTPAYPFKTRTIDVAQHLLCKPMLSRNLVVLLVLLLAAAGACRLGAGVHSRCCAESPCLAPCDVRGAFFFKEGGGVWLANGSPGNPSHPAMKFFSKFTSLRNGKEGYDFLTFSSSVAAVDSVYAFFRGLACYTPR
jgi:hypothetical protein